MSTRLAAWLGPCYKGVSLQCFDSLILLVVISEVCEIYFSLLLLSWFQIVRPARSLSFWFLIASENEMAMIYQTGCECVPSTNEYNIGSIGLLLATRGSRFSASINIGSIGLLLATRGSRYSSSIQLVVISDVCEIYLCLAFQVGDGLLLTSKASSQQMDDANTQTV
ncbi:uncharacterized protein LOC131253097 [Magnolia sinica]|uniref:uncharacterized protein LOC131253097 n=1 Tax=Magnolia sinica TaxID=86752 RepID=UPI002659BAE0|nr:uncharacterized protein LOC131253097 [Magnolia sinica]